MKLNKDLTIIKNWVFQWEIDFNPDPKKQDIEVFFSRKIISNNPNLVSFNQFQVEIFERHKHQGLMQDTKSEINKHLEDKINKCKRYL